MSMLAQSVVFLCAAVIAVPLSKRLGLGSVLGYLGAGIVIGPYGLRLISGVDEILHFAELGVVLLLFVIGLELQPRRLWALRKAVFGLGAAQVVHAINRVFGGLGIFGRKVGVQQIHEGILGRLIITHFNLTGNRVKLLLNLPWCIGMHIEQVC